MNKEPENNIAKVLLPSGALYKVSLFSSGFLGKVSNSSHRFRVLSKAGRNRWLGRRPSVRGSAMNPIDHPHGGGEGGKSGGKPSRTPWGFPTQGYPTRKYKKNKYFIRLIKKRSK
jgi:large subunit ribosomal protein L2